MAVALFVGFHKDVLFSRSITQFPGTQLKDKIELAYETTKKVRVATAR